MRFEDAILSSDAPKTKVVVVCHDADRDEAKSIIDAFAPLGWQQTGEIRLLEAGTRPQFREAENGDRRVVRQEPAYLRTALDRFVPPGEAARVILVGKVRLNPDLTPSDLRAPTRVTSTAELSKALPQILASGGLDWLSHLARLLAHYHFEIDREAIGVWRQQFAVFGDARWVADALLKLLDFWPSSRVCKALFHPPGCARTTTDNEIYRWLDSYDHIAFNDAESGDSSAMICRLAKTRIGELLSAKRVDFARHVQDCTRPCRILLLEDCVLTGTEIVRLFDSLPIEQLRLHKIDMKFATGTLSGRKRLGAYCNARGFSDVHILESPGGLMPNLTEAGLACAETGLFDQEGELLDPSQHIIHGIQLRAQGHFNNSQRKNIVSFCEAVGGPLMRLLLHQMEWPAEKIDAVLKRWALGFSGLGLLLAFAHGVPKPTLPLLWIEGEISVEFFGYRWKGLWKPLFPRPLGQGIGMIKTPTSP